MTADSRVLSGRYRLDEPIGRGGMASVFRGYDLTLGREVAIKILAPDLAKDSAFRTRFRLEAQAASRMAHPTIVRVFDAGEDSETGPDGVTRPVPYIVMELVHGVVLKDVIAAGPVSTADAIRYTDGILEALAYSHRAGVVHRDIKPGNVMVTADGQIKVMDFGIARAVSDSSSTVAETTTILGTASYFSPEQAKGEPVDARADLYSAGIVLYELLTGRPPFRGESPVAVAYQHVSEAPIPPSEVTESAPRSLDPVVLRALAKDPFRRYPDAATFREAVDEAASGAAPSDAALDSLTSELYGPDPRQAADTARSLRQLSSDTTMKRTQQGPPVAWIWGGVAVLAVLLVSVLFWVVTIRPSDDVPSASHTVPTIAGMNWESAQKSLAEAGLVPRRIDQSDGAVPNGTVIRTEPDAGSTVTSDQQIRVYVSKGVETTTVPTLVGLSTDAARAALETAGLVAGTVQPQSDPNLAAGTVISATQQAGTVVSKGSTVNLVAATGRVVIVDVGGYTVDAAKRQLEAIGLTVQTQDDPNCRASSPRTVATQSLAPGDAPIHSTVILTSCSAPGP